MSRLRMAIVAVSVASAATISVAEAKSAPTWDKVITDGGKRFKVLKDFQDEAVLDQETGLVWQREPNSSPNDWANSVMLCTGTIIGGRRGWRLPTIWELMSLSDPGQNDPSLTPGHPFIGISTETGYWSSTPVPDQPTQAAMERFGGGGGGVILTTKESLSLRWCVRGPGGEAPQ